MRGKYVNKIMLLYLIIFCNVKIVKNAPPPPQNQKKKKKN